MADIAGNNVAYTQVGKTEIGNVSRQAVFDLSFGDGVLTYPANGIPLSLSAMGFKRGIESLQIADQANGDGLVYKWDRANNKIRIWFPTQQTAGAGNRAGVELTGGASVVAATVLRVVVRGW